MTSNDISLDDHSIYILHEEHHYALDKLESNKGVIFLTGKAGTGKSTLLNLFKKTTKKNCIILAPTGIAAMNVKGQTIHSFFKFPPNLFSKKEYKKIPKKLLQKIDVIIIDEISMVRADLLDHIDQLLQFSAGNTKPFGGIPMVWIGDLFQLPPIITREEKDYFFSMYASSYFYASHVFSNLKDFELIELNHVFRQKEAAFIQILNRMRNNAIDDEELHFINESCLNKTINEDELTITLCATNALANFINQTALSKINNPIKMYHASIEGQIFPSQYPMESELILKVGAQVMLIRNDPAKRFVNGTIGLVHTLNDDYIEVVLDDKEKPIKIEKSNWEMVRYKLTNGDKEIETEIIGSFQQFPLKLAWAITVHKSQGKSFDRVFIDLGTGAFENGQTYVAFSRCRTLEGISLKRPLKMMDIRTDENISDFLKKWS